MLEIKGIIAALREEGISILMVVCCKVLALKFCKEDRTFKNIWLKFAKGIKTREFYADLETVPRTQKHEK